MSSTISIHFEESATHILLTCSLNATIERVFDAWTQAQQVAHWWGPRGFKTTTHSFDARSGGAWLFTMHSPDGEDYPSRLNYTEVTHPSKLAFNLNDGNDDDPNGFDVVVKLESQANTTVLTLEMAYKSAEAKQLALEENFAIEGVTQNLQQLAEYLSEPQA